MTTIDRLDARACTVPTERPESDGTFAWEATTIVLVEARAADQVGLGYSYTDAAAVPLVEGMLRRVVVGGDPLDVGRSWTAMWAQVRNLGQTGLAAAAVSAVDVALWDLRSRLLGQPLVVALDACHSVTQAYGSGGFCSYTDAELAGQLGGWAGDGLTAVKMKTGRAPADDEHRLRVARDAVGPDVALMADANGAFGRAQARRWSEVYADHGVTWFEEPVSSDDLAGLREVRAAARGPVEIAAGEYGWSLPAYQRMLEAEAVDCLQVDVTRCGGITAFRRVAALCEARALDVSAHCAPQVSAHACAAVPNRRHLEYFHDHVRIERMLFDGCLEPVDGCLAPDRGRPGHGLALREQDVETWRVA